MSGKEAINASLKVLGLTGLAGIVIVAPNAAQGLSILLKKSRVQSDNYGRLLIELKRRGLVYVVADSEGYHYSLTPAGAHRLQQVMVDELKISKPKNWDRKWRVITFDVPVRYSKQRAYFTQRLQMLGFVMLQKSMWAYPFPCFEQIEQIASHYNLLRYCTLMEVERMDQLSTKRLLSSFSSQLR